MAGNELEVCRWWWLSYFPGTLDGESAIRNQDSRLEEIGGVLDWFLTDVGKGFIRDVSWNSQRVVYFNYPDFERKLVYPRFKYIFNEPESITGVISMALCILRERALGIIYPLEGASTTPTVASEILNNNNSSNNRGYITKPTIRDKPPIIARFLNVQPLSSIRDATSIATNRLMSVRGNVTRVSSSHPMIQHMVFLCGRCGHESWMAFQFGKYDFPVRCGGADSCRGGDFQPIYESALAIDRQSIRLQELESDIQDAGRVPRTIEVELLDDLIDSCVPGDVVTVAGVLRALENETAQGRGISRGGGYVYTTFIDAHSVTTHKIDDRQGSSESGGGTANNNNTSFASSASLGSSTSGNFRLFSDRDKQLISRIRMHRDPLSLVVASSVPSIIGNETVKLGLLLGLFGGSRRNDLHASSRGGESTSSSSNGISSAKRGGASGSRAGGGALGSKQQGHHNGDDLNATGAITIHDDDEDENNDDDDDDDDDHNPGARDILNSFTATAVGVRCDPHILVVGDPGIGKSQMLKAIQSLAPRGVYVSGQSASVAGLTAAVVVAKGGDTTLEAGALVLSDQGICAIDEFDKMKHEHHALLEAMEQQRVSLAKAGVVSSLSARATVLAAANPVGGHYNRAKTISENLKMSPALLSRFDLMFIVLDKPDSLKDAQLTEHRFATMRGGDRYSENVQYNNNNNSSSGGGNSNHSSSSSFSSSSTKSSSSNYHQNAGGGVGGDDHADALTQQHHRIATQYAMSQLPPHMSSQQHPFAGGSGGGSGSSFSHQQHATSSSSSGGGKQQQQQQQLLPFRGVDESFEMRLKRGVASIEPRELLPSLALRKYVAYARLSCNPHLLPDAALRLKDFYMSLRKDLGTDEGGMPITTRQLESLIRLTEARAKIELADFVTVQHVNDVVALMKASIFDAAQVDDMGTVLDFSRVTSGMSNSKAIKALSSHLRSLINRNGGQDWFTKQELLEIIDRLGLPQAASMTARDLLEGALTANILGQRGAQYKFTG